MRTITTLAVAVGALALTASAKAAPTTPTILFLSTASSSTENTGVSAQVEFDLSHSPAGDLLTLTITNTTSPALGSSVTAVGFMWPASLPTVPSLTGGGTSTYFGRLDYDVDVSPGWMSPPGGYDLMLTSDGKYEGGSPQGAPTAGVSHTVVLDLGPASLSADDLIQAYQLNLANAAGPLAIARFQSVGPNGELSDKVMAYAVGEIVPEPATLSPTA